jgi:hypothetical protein
VSERKFSSGKYENIICVTCINIIISHNLYMYHDDPWKLNVFFKAHVHTWLIFSLFSRIVAEGAFKKLKPEPNSGLSSVSGSGMSSPGSGISSLPHHAGHTPTTVSCPTPARRRHRTTFTQVSLWDDLQTLIKIYSN